ncbi:hypothetical protein WCX49_07325 [Sulfurimonas sp. HSL-1656]|uniref:hypothetical protein n=1 Tax=Thiomicrolovo subterrani TaxID=3131934 RepID=UPI0031F8ABBD
MNQIEKRFQKLLIFFILLLTLPGCWDYDTKDTSTGGVEIIDGHTLPPDPGEAGKNTLLGIDSNNDGVRDDVERWIYKTYNHPIERAIFIQTARAYQLTNADPSRAEENLPIMQRATACVAYWRLNAKADGRSYWLERYRNLYKEIRPIQFNTDKRFLAYEKYNNHLSGESISLLGTSMDNCDFNASELMRKYQ